MIIPKETIKQLEPGVIYRYHENNELVIHESGHKYPFYAGETYSHNGNKLITKLVICPKCKKLIQGMQQRVSLCPKCNKKAYRKEVKNKVETETALWIAHKITGDYPRVCGSLSVEPSWEGKFFDVERGLA